MTAPPANATVPFPELTLVIHALHSGGAERTLAGMANHWAEQGVAVTLITLDEVATDAFPLHPSVRRVGLGLMQPSRSRWQGIRNVLRRIRRLRQAIAEAKARVVLSFTDKMNVLTLLACLGTQHRVVIAERSNPQRQKLGRMGEILRRLTYRRCAAAVVQTEAAARYLARLVRKRPVHVIPNAVAQCRRGSPKPAGSDVSANGTPSVQIGPAPAGDSSERASRRVSESPAYTAPRVVIGLGRLSPEKGFDVLIRAFAMVAETHRDWTLRIIGEGAQRDALQCLAASLSVAERVEFAGWTPQPEAALSIADLFVLPSRYEGFPNALLEAMACGLPVISSDCDSGPREIIRPEFDGLLVPPDDPPALASALQRLMADDALRLRLGTNATEVVTRFSQSEFFAHWERVLNVG